MSLFRAKFGLCLRAAGLIIAAASVELSSGEVRFTEGLIQDGYGYAYGIAAADLDGDGDLDLVSSDTTNDRLFWFANDGRGNFQPHFIMTDEPGWFERNAVGDINGDGRADVVVVKNLHGDIVWFENSGTPGDGKLWKRLVVATKFPRAYDVALADLDGDGDLDVAASAWTGNQFAWFENRGHASGAEWPRHLVEDQVGETRTIVAADFNRDGKPDLLGSGRTANLVVWYENSGQPATQPWKKHVIDDTSPMPTHGHPVDLDGDGDLDVVMALGLAGTGAGQAVWYENAGRPGTGLQWTRHELGDLPWGSEAVAGDLDGDGDLDVAATSWGERPGGKVVWFENSGDPRGPWTLHLLKENWTRANQVILADLNGDGRLDVAAVAERGANEFRWWRNEGVHPLP